MPGGEDEEPEGSHERPGGDASGAADDRLEPDLEADLDDDLDDDLHPPSLSRGPLPPDDRLWRHPSELATTGLPAAATPPPPVPPPAKKRRPRPGRVAPGAGRGQRVLAIALSGIVGALLMAGMLVASGRLRRGEVTLQLPTTPSSAVTVGASSPVGAAALVARIQSGVLAVQATRPNEPTVHGSALALRHGYAVTALRVVDGATSITVHGDGAPRPARVVGSDTDTDLALLALEGDVIEPPSFGSSAALRPGDTAVTITAPAANSSGPSVTVGVVSALDRTMVAGKNVLRGVLQLDRPVPSEGAGGALIDATGEVVGVTLPAADPASQMGYAIPMDAVNDVSNQLIASGHVSRPWLGIEGGDDDVTGGANVYTVRPASPAARAGVQVGDVVSAFDGTPVKTMDNMLILLRARHPGDKVMLTIMRKGKAADLQVVLAER